MITFHGDYFPLSDLWQVTSLSISCLSEHWSDAVTLGDVVCGIIGTFAEYDIRHVSRVML